MTRRRLVLCWSLAALIGVLAAWAIAVDSANAMMF